MNVACKSFTFDHVLKFSAHVIGQLRMAPRSLQDIIMAGFDVVMAGHIVSAYWV